MGNRLMFIIILVGAIISTIFTIKLSISTSSDFFTQILLGGMGFILQFGSYSCFGFGIVLLNKKNSIDKKIIGVICLLLTFILFVINIIGSAGLIYETSRNAYIKDSLSSKEYKNYDDEYNKNKTLENKEIENQNKIKEKLSSLYIEDKKNIKSNREEEYSITIKEIEKKYDQKIKNTKIDYDNQIKEKERIYHITTKDGADYLRSEKEKEINNINNEKEKEINNINNEKEKDITGDINSLDGNIKKMEKELEKTEKNITIYKKEKNIAFDKIQELKKEGDLNSQRGYTLILANIFGNIGETTGAWLFLIMATVFEILILILTQILFVYKKYNFLKDIKQIKQKYYETEKEKPVLFKNNNNIKDKDEIKPKKNIIISTKSFSLDEYFKNRVKQKNCKLKNICEDILKTYEIKITSRQLSVELKKRGIQKTKTLKGYSLYDI